MPLRMLIIEPIAVPIFKASQITGISRSAIYRELGAGNLCAVKQGARTLVMVDSVRVHLAGLPMGQICTALRYHGPAQHD